MAVLGTPAEDDAQTYLRALDALVAAHVATGAAAKAEAATRRALELFPGNIPLQLVKANPAMGMGAMSGVTYTQRVATKGGVAPAMACGSTNVGAKQIVQYQADYIFYKAS